MYINKKGLSFFKKVWLISGIIMFLTTMTMSSIGFTSYEEIPKLNDENMIQLANKSEHTAQLYIIMYVSSGITLSSMLLCYKVFNRSSKTIDKLLDNLMVMEKANSHENQCSLGSHSLNEA